ncbi:MAG: tetraacyldisaccharide 4'-kinase, partial [Rubrivivax sp.]|nr:tetraacyldisaccharide 4'-kinase [Rubrivivax sp.]
IDIALIPRCRNLSQSCMLPKGMLREPPSAIARADVIVLTGTREEPWGQGISVETPWWRRWNSRAPVFRACLVPDYLYEVVGGTRVSVDDLRGRRISAFCGIARPARFFSMLEHMGIEVSSRWTFPDHHRYTMGDANLLRECFDSADVVVTTEKDAVKMTHHTWRNTQLLALKVSLQFEDEEGFLRTLFEKLSAHRNSSPQGI